MRARCRRAPAAGHRLVAQHSPCLCAKRDCSSAESFELAALDSGETVSDRYRNYVAALPEIELFTGSILTFEAGPNFLLTEKPVFKF